MHYPDFFDQIEPITLYDPLTQILGINNDGTIPFTYLDVVKLAGHSCPTTAGAFLMLKRGLNELYHDTLPKRGNIIVEFRQLAASGTSGVIASIVSMVTGASDEKGFKGIGGEYARNSRLFFGRPIPMLMRLTREDTGRFVDIDYSPASVPEPPRLPPLKARVIADTASKEELHEFRNLWQESVSRILLEYGEMSELITVCQGP